MSATSTPSSITSLMDQGCTDSDMRSNRPTQRGAGGLLAASSINSMKTMNRPGATTAQNATLTAANSLPRSQVSLAAPRMVVEESSPATDIPISGDRLAIKNTTAAVMASASGRSIGSTGFLAMVILHRVQTALPPGGSGGTRCCNSHSRHATVSIATPFITAGSRSLRDRALTRPGSFRWPSG